MTKTFKIAEIAAASLIALGALSIAAPAHAEDATKKQYNLDTRTTGSILSFGRACAATDAKADCRIEQDEQAAKYPSAPMNFAFGF